MPAEVPEEVQACHALIDRLLEGLWFARTPFNAELAKLAEWVGEVYEREGRVPADTLGEKIVSLTPEAQEYVRSLF